MYPFVESSSSLCWGEASYLCPLAEGILCSLLVLVFAQPRSESRGLQGSPVGKGQFPRLRQRGLIHGIQVDRSLLFTLTSRQEADSCKKEVSRLRNRVFQQPQSLTFTRQRSGQVRGRRERECRDRNESGITRNSSRNGAEESSDSCYGDILRGVLLGAGMPGRHHVGFQQCPFQVYMMIVQSLVDSSQNLKTGGLNTDLCPDLRLSLLWKDSLFCGTVARSN